jgi:ABC-type bacteriocin/lantibiotic exporter with double-glycine peptidase domain
VVGVEVRLEDGDDRSADPFRRSEVLPDELVVRVAHREPRFRQAAEEIARARGRLVEEGTEKHLRLRRSYE